MYGTPLDCNEHYGSPHSHSCSMHENLSESLENNEMSEVASHSSHKDEISILSAQDANDDNDDDAFEHDFEVKTFKPCELNNLVNHVENEGYMSEFRHFPYLCNDTF